MKDEISKSYMEEQKAKHAAKPLKDKRQAFVVGAADRPNIGSAIADHLKFLLGVEIVAPDIVDFNVCDLDPEFSSSDHLQNSDILVLANGFSHLDWFEDVTFRNIDKTFAINVVGSLKAANVFVNETIEKPWKKYIVFIGSMAYRNVLNGSAVYCASKAALAMATRCLAWELAPKGYNVFCVHPSNTEGAPMSEKTIEGLMRYRNLSRAEAEAYWGAVLPKAEWLQPEDIAETVSFLVSGKADYMSGSNVELAGGQR